MRYVYRTAALILLASACCLAQDNPRQRQVDAAVDRAVAALRRQVVQMPLGDKLTVSNLLDDTGGYEQLDRILRRSQMIGGPRWITPEVCQVRLEIAGIRVADVIGAIAAAHPGASPIPATELQKELAAWSGRNFVADGTGGAAPATSRSAAPPLPPPPPTSRPAELIPDQPPAWAGAQIDVSGESPPLASALQTLAAARLDALKKLKVRVDALALSGSLTLGQAAAKDDAIARAVKQGLDQAEIDRVHYRETGAVDLRLSLQLWRLWRELAAIPRP